MFKFTIRFYTFVRKSSEDVISIICYDPLWSTLKQKNISQYYLIKNGLDNKTLDSLKKNKNITMHTLEKLCMLIECTPNDIIEFKHYQD